MAKNDKKQDELPVEQKVKFMLMKNHGVIIDGKTNKLYEAGTEFDPESDSALISALIRSGAALEEILPPKKKLAPKDKDSKSEGEQNQQQGDDE